MKGINQPLYSGFYKTEYEHIRVIAGVYMAERNRVIANIPVRRGLKEGYWVHVNVADSWESGQNMSPVKSIFILSKIKKLMKFEIVSPLY